jgi:hypothetical protein
MHSDTRAIALPAAITGSLPRRAWYTGNPGMRSVCRTHRRSQSLWMASLSAWKSGSRAASSYSIATARLSWAAK